MDTTRYDFDSLVSREHTNSVKWDFIRAGDESVRDKLLPLWVADMDFPCAAPILEAMRERLDKNVFGYSQPYPEEYGAAVAGWFERRSGWRFGHDAIVTAPGIVPAIGMLIRALTREGDGVIIQNPVYYPFAAMITNNGRRVVNNALVNEDGRYLMDFEDLEAKAADPETTMMLLCNPHNPVGRVWTPEELTSVAGICLRHGVQLISDDIHCDLVRDSSRYTPVSVLNDDDRIITCTAVSKTFNLAGLHISNIIIQNEKLRTLWRRENNDRCGLFGANPLSIAASQAAYNEGGPWLEQVNAYIDANLAFVGEFVAEHFPRARYRVPEGTYFAWIDFRDYGYEAGELEELMLYRANVALSEGYVFGGEGRGFERINTACPRVILEECLQRMARVLP